MSQPLNNYLPGFASLLEQIDRRVLVLLRDVERIYIGNEFGEIDRGVFLIRGENVVLCGEVDEDADTKPPGFTKVPIEVILESQARTVEEKSNRDKLKLKALQERGMLLHADGLADDM